MYISHFCQIETEIGPDDALKCYILTDEVCPANFGKYCKASKYMEGCWGCTPSPHFASNFAVVSIPNLTLLVQILEASHQTKSVYLLSVSDEEYAFGIDMDVFVLLYFRTRYVLTCLSELTLSHYTLHILITHNKFTNGSTKPDSILSGATTPQERLEFST